MAARRSLVLILATVFASMGASYRTTNFVVEAATPEIARRVGDYAEFYRKEKALQWLGHEMAPWGRPCPLQVTVTMNGAGGATSFAYDQGQVLDQEMHIEGPLERLLNSVEQIHESFPQKEQARSGGADPMIGPRRRPGPVG